MKCSIMLHFILVFTVCQSTYLGVSSIQRVKSVTWNQGTSLFWGLTSYHDGQIFTVSGRLLLALGYLVLV